MSSTAAAARLDAAARAGVDGVVAEVGANFDEVRREPTWAAAEESTSPDEERRPRPRTKRLFTSASFRVLEAALITALRTLRAGERLAPLWVVAPTNILCAHLARRLAAEDGGHANVRFLTLVDVATEIAAANLLAAGRTPAPPYFDRALIRTLVAAADGADVFASVGDTPGFQQALLAVFRDLADACLEPSALRAVADGARPDSPVQRKLGRLADLAEQVRVRMAAEGAYDRSDLLRAAVGRLESVPVDLPSPLLVYGFYDFTSLQRRLLAAAMRYTDTLAWMPWDDSPVFSYAAPTRTWFQNLGFQLAALPLPDATPTDLQRAQRTVFQTPVGPEPAADGSLQIISAPGELREAREIARRVLRLVSERDLAFHQIGIVLRSPEPYQRLIADELERAHIPYSCAGRASLDRTVAGRALLLLLQIRLENFTRTRVIEWLSIAPLPPADRDVTAASCDWFTRAAGVVAGADEWHTRMARLAALYDDTSAPPQVRRQRRSRGRTPDDLARCRALMARLIADLSQIPDRGGWDVLVPRCLDIYRQWVDDPAVESIAAALQHLAAFDRLESEVSLQTVADACAEILQSTTTPAGQFGQGVFVGDIMQARGVPFRAVIIPGLVEKVLPRPIHQDPILPDAEREVLNDQFGAELSLKQRGFDEERLLFGLMLDAAEASLTLTFPRLDAATARERLPSWYLLHVMAAVRGHSGGFADLESWDRIERVPLSRLFADDPRTALDRTEFDLSSAAAAVAGNDVGLVRHVFAPSLARRALVAEGARAGTAQFTPFDGVFGADVARRALYRQPLRLSASRLQTYARCPFQYFLRYELDLEPLVEPELVVTLASREVGTLVHRILHEFFVAATAAGLLPLKAARRGDAVALMDRVIGRESGITAMDGLTGMPLLWERLKEEIRGAMLGLLDDEIETADGYLPVRFEASFGDPGSIVDMPLSDGGSARFSGRIDRIDFHPDGGARVIDYKTGRPRSVAADEVEIEAIQLPLYLYAERRLHPEREWRDACFAFVGDARRRQRQIFAPTAWQPIEASLIALVDEIAAGILRGVFPAGRPTCRPCAFPSICHAARPLFARKTGGGDAG